MIEDCQGVEIHDDKISLIVIPLLAVWELDAPWTGSVKAKTGASPKFLPQPAGHERRQSG